MGAVRTTCRLDNDRRIRNRFNQLGRLVERSFTNLITQISGKLINKIKQVGIVRILRQIVLQPLIVSSSIHLLHMLNQFSFDDRLQIVLFV